MKLLRNLLAATTVLGLVFVATAWRIVPSWLLTMLLIGLSGFVAATALAFLGKRAGYWLGMALAVTVLAISLPAPAHIFFLTSGRVLESGIFLVGNLLQIIYVAAFIRYILLRRRLSRGLSQPP
uniref:Uncharacterized protein n=1 Tax=Caldiarchaeum subterraneum TaxID=311458 RepID=E6N7H3_CALS0|nr:conserved hypothetical protein [Candidatus Caldarchaeum subterraneum]